MGYPSTYLIQATRHVCLGGALARPCTILVSLDEIVNADWRIGGHASPLDLDERIREPTIDYDPQSVVCTVSGMTAAMKSGQRDTLPPHCWTPDHEYGS